MSAVRCDRCGHGHLDGFDLAWTAGGKLLHRDTMADPNDEDSEPRECVAVVGFARGFGPCAMGEHAVPVDQLYLAEVVSPFAKENVIAPRRPGHVEPYFIRFGREAWPYEGSTVEVAIEEDADWPFGEDLPAGTKGVIFEVRDEKRTPYAACVACVERHIDYDTPIGKVWRLYGWPKKRPAKLPRDAAARASTPGAGRTSSAASSASPDSSGGRLNDLRALLSEPASTASIAERMSVSERTVQRLLGEVGATSSRKGRYIVWSLPTDDTPTTDDTGDTSPVADGDDG